MKQIRRAIALNLALLMACVPLSGCAASGGSQDAGGVKLTSYDSITLGENTDLSADVRILQGELDLAPYVEEFQELYPNIAITIVPRSPETELAQAVSQADLIAIPGDEAVADPQDLFHRLAKTSAIEGQYRFSDLLSENETAYAIPSVSFVDGILYSKAAFASVPTTPEAFWTALGNSKLYISEQDVSVLDGFCGVTATGDVNWLNRDMMASRTPFDNAGVSEVYRTVYDGLTRGAAEIGTESGPEQVAAGTAAAAIVSGRELAGIADPGNLGLMPFPVSVDGVQYAAAQLTESYAVNKESSTESKLAAMIFIKWLSESSSLAEDLCAVPAVKTAPLPALLSDFQNVTLSIETSVDPASAQWVADARGLPGLPMGSGADHLHALSAAENFSDLMTQWNQLWTDRYTIVRTGRDYTTLPALMTMEDGTPVETAEQFAQRRTELLNLFETNVYGYMPRSGYSVGFEVLEEGDALGGTALRKQIKITVTTEKGSSDAIMLLYLPKSEQPVPVIIGLNFYGNHQVLSDEAILASASFDEEITADTRGADADSWCIEEAIKRGYGMGTVYAEDFAPDDPETYNTRLISLFDNDDFMTVGAWAFGIMRMADYLETDPAVDMSRVADVGFSRLGKAALWAGAQDERFDLVISNCSGNSGASLARGSKGETVGSANSLYPHWFSDTYKSYNDRVEELPVDQHELLACVAPRHLYVGSAAEDIVTDPQNSWNALMFARDAFRIYGLGVIEDDAVEYVEEQPAPDTRLFSESIAYHIRSGGHAITPVDWTNYFDYMGTIW